MKRTEWEKLIASLSPGMTQTGAAARLRRPSASVRYWLKKLDYRFKDGRCGRWTEARRKACRLFDYGKIDWAAPNIEISRKFDVSRERIRQVRRELGKVKINGRKSHARQQTT